MRPLPTLLRTTALTLALGAGLLVIEAGSVVVAPTAVYLDHQTRASSVVLYNPGTEPEEVTVEAVLGYPTTGDDGTLYLHLEEEAQDPRSAAPWIRAFPRQVVVGPGERRTVRLLGEPPADLPDGEYWTRLIFTSRGQSLPVDAPPGAGGVQVGLDLEVRTVIAATYRKGAVATGLEVVGFEPRQEEGALRFRSRLERSGTAAWIGLLQLELRNAQGAAVQAWEEQVAVYDRYDRAFAFPLETLPPGTYQLHARFTTDREDVPEAFRLEAPDVVLTAEVELR